MTITIHNVFPADTDTFEDNSNSALFFLKYNGRPIVGDDSTTIRVYVGYPDAADAASRIANGYTPIVTAPIDLARFDV